MSAPLPVTPRTHRARWITASAVTAVLAVIATVAVVWPGFDAQQTPVQDASVWALQTDDGRRYARVNTELGELETVKNVENPSGTAQSGEKLFVYADGNSKYADVSLATPPDLTTDNDDAFQATPSGTTDVATNGDFLAYRTSEGDVFAGQISTGGATVAIDPYADVEVDESGDALALNASAIAVTEDGIVFAASLENQSMVTANAVTGEVLSEETLDMPQDASVQLSAVGESWVLLVLEEARLLTSSGDVELAESIALTSRLQEPGPASDIVYLADDAGLLALTLGGDEQALSERVATASGTPAPPTSVGGDMHAAWLSSGAGTLWSVSEGARSLDFASGTLGDQPSPEITRNGERAILNDTSSGWVWSLPDGVLVPSSQEWEPDTSLAQEQQQEVVTEKVLEPRAPVARDDAFGVRAGRTVTLPVLLNDYDANEDVLSITSSSIAGIDPGFATINVTNQGQELTATVAASAEGSAAFTYQVTDGTSSDGLTSEAATVTLSVIPEEVNTAPVWCGVEGCLASWPNPEVEPGSTTSITALEGWVDPEGDPIYLSDATNQSGVGATSADPGGVLTYQHPDPNASDLADISLTFTVADTRGAFTESALTVAVVATAELRAESFSVVGAAGTPLTVDVGSHTTGGDTSLSLSEAVALSDTGASVVSNATTLSFVINSPEPGVHLVQYTVRDEAGEATALARVTLMDPEKIQVTTPPLTAFVRPNEDASIDVLPSASNPAGRVLLVSDLRPEAEQGASLSADAVDQSLIRVSGDTSDGQPGSLGTIGYTVSDGSGTALTTATGELTVILLPAATADAPIAIDDTVTVRAGAQVDIPVLENDTAPTGAVIAVDPSTIVNESDAGLAFATSRLVRFLAPASPGTYSVSYTAYRLGFPEMTNTARVFVTVLPAEQNTAPIPADLTGRVRSGASVAISFDEFGIDPDGDAVSLDRVLTQPEQGSATISAAGNALVYTSTPGTSGQDAFTFQVRDAQGQTGTATARVGVLDAQSDPRPVAYSDYAQAQAGEESTIIARPIDNDADPAGGALELVDVYPNAQPDTDEYATIAAMLTRIDTDTGEVTLRAGTELGTYSFVYEVQNETGDTAQGLLILKVVRSPVPDYPVVADTVLTVETREELEDGVNVIDGMVTWSGGTVASLDLSLWEEESGYSVSGSEISGALPEDRTIVPFRLSGTSFAGTDIETYGFLRIPGDNDLQLSLRESFRFVEVEENSTIDIDMTAAVAVPAATTLQIDDSAVSASGARAQATCAVVSDTVVRYTAGAGAPWNDVCTVPVKLATQDAYSYLPVRVTVIAEAPQPELRAAALSVSPGAETTYNLSSMTTWQGTNDVASLEYDVSYAGDQFTVKASGASLTIAARDDARPGRVEPLLVSLPGHPDTVPATLSLSVGPAPSTLPKGGTATQQCSQAGGATSCTIAVIGTSGEVNPLPGTALSLVSVSAGSSCEGVSFARASDTAVTASWRSDAAGASSCTGSFVVQDAQQRTSSGDRVGTVILDLQGLPDDPARLNWTSYSADSVTVRVVPGASSYPAVTGYRVTGGAVEVTCSASGECPPIAAANGDQVAYQAWALNAVGESRTSVAATAWAYQAPAAPTALASRPTGENTASISMTIGDASTGSVALQLGATTVATKAVSGAGTVTFADVNVGTNVGGTYASVVPSTRFEVPPQSIVAGGSSEGQSSVVETSGIGLPPVVLTFTDGNVSGFSGTVTATATVTQPQAKTAELYIGFGAFPNDTACTPSQRVGTTTGTLSKSYANVGILRSASYSACAEYRFGGETFGTMTQSAEHTLIGTLPNPTGDATYAVTMGGQDGDASRTSTLTHQPTLTSGGSGDFVVLYFRGGGTGVGDFASLFTTLTSTTDITAKTCTTDGATCSSGVAVTTTGARYLARVAFASTCGATPAVTNPSTGAPVASSDWAFTAPTEANPTATVSFSGGLSSYGTTTYTYANCAAPEPPAPEPPAPEPSAP